MVTTLADISVSDPHATPVRVRTWSAEEFGASQPAWDDLVRQSDADPLFMSWDWQWRWWSHHAQVLGATLRLAAAYSGDRLIGLAPFYSRTIIVRRILQARRLELIGIAWRDPRAMFSDYLDIVAASGFRDAVIQAIDAWLAAQPFWDELVLCCTKRTSVAAQLAQARLGQWTYIREVDPSSGWCTRLPSAFEDYVKRLGPHNRRRLFNQRRKLADPRVEYASEADLNQTLALLWRLSAERWGSGGPAASVQAFHRDIAACLARTGDLRLSRLITAEGTRSVLYNVRRGDTVYYLQSGFDPTGAQGLSLGFLHFGYAIEAACKEQAKRFDFLAGRGRNRDYKRDLLTESVPVVSYHAVRGPMKRALYAAYEIIRGRRDSLTYHATCSRKR